MLCFSVDYLRMSIRLAFSVMGLVGIDWSFCLTVTCIGFRVISYCVGFLEDCCCVSLIPINICWVSILSFFFCWIGTALRLFISIYVCFLIGFSQIHMFCFILCYWRSAVFLVQWLLMLKLNPVCLLDIYMDYVLGLPQSLYLSISPFLWLKKCSFLGFWITHV